jgi:hypothetical protein
MISTQSFFASEGCNRKLLGRALLALLSGLALSACDRPTAVARPVTTTVSAGDTATPAPDAMTSQLRTMWLTLKPGDVASPPAGKHVYGAAFEMNLGEATATVVTLVDGSTSLYFSTGGGSIGLGGHANVRAASERFLAAAEQSLGQFAGASDHAYPPAGQAHFYALTDRGLLRTGSSAMDAIEGDESHALRRLYEAGQDLLTEVRLANEKTQDTP